jgi:hypothetical protein
MSGSTATTDRRTAAVAAVVLAAALLAALLPSMARVPAQLQAPVGPLAAPEPAVLTSTDFPERASNAGACIAVLERSSAVGNPRSPVAGAITGGLLEDACFGG